MAYDLDEQEQLASLKAWWNAYGNLLTWVITIALAGYAGWNAWNYYQRSQALEASQLFEEVQKAATLKDVAKMQRAATDMESKYARTAYAQMSGLLAAKTAYEGNDLKAAKAQLQWVIDHAIDDEFKFIAKLRLAGVLLDEKAYDEGLKLMAGDFPAEFAVVAADRKGDLLMAQNKPAEARVAYQAALDKSDKKSPVRSLIQLKLDDLGGAKAAS
jgi:predicted negative regulator of RcsB-dependent stress response